MQKLKFLNYEAILELATSYVTNMSQKANKLLASRVTPWKQTDTPHPSEEPHPT